MICAYLFSTILTNKTLTIMTSPGYFMNCCRETKKMGVPPGNRPAVPRDSEEYLNGTSQGPTPEDARKDGHIRGRSK
jgi:hypothetical protein